MMSSIERRRRKNDDFSSSSPYIGARRHRSFIEKKQFVVPSSLNSHLLTRSNSIKATKDEVSSINDHSNDKRPLTSSNLPSFVHQDFRLTSTPVENMFSSPIEFNENFRRHSFDQRIIDENDKYIIQLCTDEFEPNDFRLSVDEFLRHLIIDAKHREEDHLGGYVHRELHKIFTIPQHVELQNYQFRYDSNRRELTVEMNANRSSTMKKTQLKISFDMNDYQPEDIKVTIQNQELVVKAERSIENDTEKCRMSFYQSTVLPVETDIERLESNYLDGKLFIEAPLVDRIERPTKSSDKTFQRHTMTMKEASRRL